MQKQKKQFAIILIVLVVLVAITFGVKLYNEKQEEKDSEEADAAVIHVVSAETADITAFSYELNGETLSFSKEGDDWKYDGDATLDMNEDSIESMLETLVSLTASEEVDDYETLADYGLDNPTDTISFSTDSGMTTVYVGNQNEMLGEYYVKMGDSDKVYLTSTSLASVFSSAVEDLIVEEDTESVEDTEKVTEEN